MTADVAVPDDYLWRSVVRRATARLDPAVRPVRNRMAFLGVSEVGNLDVTSLINQDILWLDVAVADVLTVGLGHRLALSAAAPTHRTLLDASQQGALLNRQREHKVSILKLL